MTPLLALIALTGPLIQLPEPLEPALDEVLAAGSLTRATARFDENLLRFFRSGEFDSSFYHACSENPWRVPFFASILRGELAGQSGTPNLAVGSLSRLLGVPMRRTLLGNPNAVEETNAKKSGALAAYVKAWFEEYLDNGSRGDFKSVPQPVQEAATLVLSVMKRARTFRNLAIRNMGTARAYEMLCQTLADDETGRAFEDQRKAFSQFDLGTMLAASHDVALAAQTAAEWVKSVPRDAKYEAAFDTPWGWVVLSGGANTSHVDRPCLLVIDTGGDDTYLNAPATRSESNWASVLIDTSGNDKYLSDPKLATTPVNQFAGRKPASNKPGPGGAVLGVSVLIDLQGNDLYRSHSPGLASGRCGFAALLDKEGDDTYDAYQDSEGFGMFGEGLLEDLSGKDTYRGFLQVQGVGQTRGVGYLVDRAGDDQYLAEDKVIDFPSAQSAQHNTNMAQGAGNGRRGDYLDSHSLAGGVGILFDQAGNDRYSCSLFGQGAGYWEGVGMLWDTGGSDHYEGQWYVQGASAHFAIGYLEDNEGDDTYIAPMNMAQGAGHDFSVGWLLDRAGNDVHQAPNLSLGAGNANGIGVFADLAGDDKYESSGTTLGKANEHAAGSIRLRCLCLGVFLDLAGTDAYPTSATWMKNGTKGMNMTTQAPSMFESALGCYLDR